MQARSVAIAGLAIAVVSSIGTTEAPAALTAQGCLAAKLKAAGNFRKCRDGEQAKILQGKPGDVVKCMTKFQNAIAKLDEKASDAAIACRYGDNGDGTVTDYDTQLQWEKKDGVGGGANAANPHDVDNRYSWSTVLGTTGTGFLDQLNGESSTGTNATGCFAGHCDWRLPTVVELQALLLEPNPCGTSPCIDPIFGPTDTWFYWSSTTRAPVFPSDGWVVYFVTGTLNLSAKSVNNSVRAVRGGL